MFPKTSRFLVIEDMASMRDFMQASLNALGFQTILLANDGASGLDLLRKQSLEGHPVDVILCDWNMPKMMGIDLLKTIREVSEWEFTPFIMITTESEKAQILNAISAGVSEYIVKPFSIAILEAKLKAVYDRSLAKSKSG